MGLNDLDVCESGIGALLCFYRSTLCVQARGSKHGVLGVVIILHSELFHGLRSGRDSCCFCMPLLAQRGALWQGSPNISFGGMGGTTNTTN